jgi:hypothetical protein
MVGRREPTVSATVVSPLTAVAVCVAPSQSTVAPIASKIPRRGTMTLPPTSWAGTSKSRRAPVYMTVT